MNLTGTDAAGPCETDTGDEGTADVAASGIAVTAGAAIADADRTGVLYAPGVLRSRGTGVRVQPGVAATCGVITVALPWPLGLLDGDELMLAGGEMRAQA